jgi:hypothetical protein
MPMRFPMYKGRSSKPPADQFSWDIWRQKGRTCGVQGMLGEIVGHEIVVVLRPRFRTTRVGRSSCHCT